MDGYGYLVELFEQKCCSPPERDDVIGFIRLIKRLRHALQ